MLENGNSKMLQRRTKKTYIVSRVAQQTQINAKYNKDNFITLTGLSCLYIWEQHEVQAINKNGILNISITK